MSQKIINGIDFFGLLTIVFVTLKLTGFISWSWWIVLFPIFIPFAISISILILSIVIACLIACFK